MTTPTPAQQLEDVVCELGRFTRSGPHDAAAFVLEHAPTLRRALAALEAVEWRPIETAPKDGTRVDLWAGERIFNALWRCPSPEVHGDDPECFTWWAPQCEDVGSWGEVWEESQIWVNPTHWMPIPAPPADAVEVSRG